MNKLIFGEKMSQLNTKNIIELEEAFDSVIKKWNVQVYSGIKDGNVKMEGGVPWMEVAGNFNSMSARAFIKDLATALNIRMFYTRLENYADGNVLYGAFDLNPEAIEDLPKNVPIPSYANDDEKKYFIDHYGREVFPKGYRKNSKKNT